MIAKAQTLKKSFNKFHHNRSVKYQEQLERPKIQEICMHTVVEGLVSTYIKCIYKLVMVKKHSYVESKVKINLQN